LQAAALEPVPGIACGNSGAANCQRQLAARDQAEAIFLGKNCVVCHQAQRVTRCARIYHHRLPPPRFKLTVTLVALKPGHGNNCQRQLFPWRITRGILSCETNTRRPSEIFAFTRTRCRWCARKGLEGCEAATARGAGAGAIAESRKARFFAAAAAKNAP
jgi:hypothetical protein